jgi:nucleoside-diphosphate-sugar epimerase
MKGGFPPLVAPETARDYVFVEDACRAFELAAKRAPPGAIYNVASGQQTSLRELLGLTRRALDVRVEPDWGSAPARRWDTDIWLGDMRRIERELGWSPQTDLSRGFEHTIQWFEALDEVLKSRYEA